MEDAVIFLHADIRQSFLQVKTTSCSGHGLTCSYNQPNCNILRRVIYQKGLYAQVQSDFTCCIWNRQKLSKLFDLKIKVLCFCRLW